MSETGHLHRWIEDAVDSNNDGDRLAVKQWDRLREAATKYLDVTRHMTADEFRHGADETARDQFEAAFIEATLQGAK